MSKGDQIVLYVGIAGLSPKYMKGNYAQVSKKPQAQYPSNLLPAVLVRYPSIDIQDCPFPKYVYNYIFPMGISILPERPTKRLEGHYFAYTTTLGRLIWGVAQQFALPLGDEARGTIQVRCADVKVTVQSYSLYSIFVLITEGHFSKINRIINHYIDGIRSEKDFQGVCQRIYELFPIKRKLPYTITIDLTKQAGVFGTTPLLVSQQECPNYFHHGQKPPQAQAKQKSALSQAIINNGAINRQTGDKRIDKLSITFDTLSNGCFPAVSVSFISLFQYVSPQAIVDTLEALLQSRPVLFVGKSLSRVSICTIEMWALLAPFSYPFPFLPVMSGLQMQILHSPFPVLAGSYRSLLVGSVISPLLHVVDIDVGRVIPPYELLSSKYGGCLMRYALPRNAVSSLPVLFYLDESASSDQKHSSQHKSMPREATLYNTFNLEGTDEGYEMPNVLTLDKNVTSLRRKFRLISGASHHGLAPGSTEAQSTFLPTAAEAYQKLSTVSKDLQQLVPSFFSLFQICRIISMNSYLFTLSKSIQLSYDSSTMQSDSSLKTEMFPLPSGDGIANFATKASADNIMNKRSLVSKSVNNITDSYLIYPINAESSNSGDSFRVSIEARQAKSKKMAKKQGSKLEKKRSGRSSLDLGSNKQSSKLIQSLVMYPEQSVFPLDSKACDSGASSSPSNIFRVPELPNIIKQRLLKLIDQTARIFVDKESKRKSAGKQPPPSNPSLQASSCILPNTKVNYGHDWHVGSAAQKYEQAYFQCISDSDEESTGAQYPNPITLATMKSRLQKAPMQLHTLDLLSANIHCTFSSSKTLGQDYSIAKKIYSHDKETYFDYKGYQDELERLESLQLFRSREGVDATPEYTVKEEEEANMYADRLQTGFIVILLDLVKCTYYCFRKRPYTELLVDKNFVQIGASSISVPRYKTGIFNYLAPTKDKEHPYYIIPALSSLSEKEISSGIFTAAGIAHALRRIVPDNIRTNVLPIKQDAGKYDEVFDYMSFLAITSPQLQNFMRYFAYTPFFEEFLESRLLFSAQLDGYFYHPVFKSTFVAPSKRSSTTSTSITSTFSDSCTSFVSMHMPPFMFAGSQQGHSFQFADCISDTTAMTFSFEEQSSRPSSPLTNITNNSPFFVYSGELDFVDDLAILNSFYRSARMKTLQGYSFEFHAAKRGQRRHVWKQKLLTVVLQSTKVLLYWRRPELRDTKAANPHMELERQGQLRDKDSDDEGVDTAGVMIDLVPGKYIVFVPHNPLLESPEHGNCVCISTETRLLIFSMKSPEQQRSLLRILMQDEIHSNMRINSEHPISKFIVETRSSRRKALGHLMDALNNEDLTLKKNLERLLIDVYSGIPLGK